MAPWYWCLADGDKLAAKFVIDAGADNALVEFDNLSVRDRMAAARRLAS